MTDMQTLKWWIDHANALEEELRTLKEHSRIRDQRIIDAVIERNIAYNRGQTWEEIATQFADACHIDGFGDVSDIHHGDASKAYRRFREFLRYKKSTS